METLWACVCASFLLGNMGWRKQSRVHTTKEIKQNLLWGLYTLRPRIQILRGSLFQKKSYKRDIKKRFSADATIFLFCPWKREKNALKNAHIWPHYFSKLPWAAHMAKIWKSINIRMGWGTFCFIYFVIHILQSYYICTVLEMCI